ncbi:MAG: nucleotidyltransferase domain-containing protein [Holosporaceae bacterium]|jgi:predicted nucleotidyltransferase|nr:nucleotidyltransferase domain-containing protein [Holosporaceae bacterium]
MLLSDLKTKFRKKILNIANECGIDEVRVFGSTARGEATEESDVDLLVSVKEATSLLDIGRFKWKTEELLRKKVDIAFKGRIHHSIADRVAKEAKLL